MVWYTPIQDFFIKNSGMIILLLVLVVVWYLFVKTINHFVGKFFDRVDFDRTSEILAQKSVKVFLWIILVIIILAILGVNVTVFVAGLGILGFIIGFATKDILSNVFAGLMLIISRPFKVGDNVLVAGVEGVVKSIGLIACVVHTKKPEYVMVPNSKIWGGPIKNLSRLKKK